MPDEQQSLWGGGRSDGSPTGEEGARRGSLDMSELSDDLGASRSDAVRLHRQLEQRLGVVDLVLTDNRRRMLSTRRRKHRQEIRAHHMFISADEPTVAAIADMAAGDKQARSRLQEFVAENREEIRVRPTPDELKTSGEHFELLDVLETTRGHLHEHGLADEVSDVHITWGRRSRGRKSIRLGSFDFERRLVRVHPALDREWVPDFFVEFIVYHELVHAICPPEAGEKRRSVHTKEFRALERRFPRYEDAVAWESANLSRILDRE